MASTHRVIFFYEAVEGPIRGGASKKKEALEAPSEADLPYEDFLDLADYITTWGQNQWANDHGTQSDHQQLLLFINAALRLWDGKEK